MRVVEEGIKGKEGAEDRDMIVINRSQQTWFLAEMIRGSPTVFLKYVSNCFAKSQVLPKQAQYRSMSKV